jgi:betaine-aldehyde dehydrogenase
METKIKIYGTIAEATPRTLYFIMLPHTRSAAFKPLLKSTSFFIFRRVSAGVGKAGVNSLKMYIDGGEADSVTGEKMNVLDPATEEVVDTVPLGGREDARKAIDAAEDAFKRGTWSDMFNSRDRGRILAKFVEIVREQEDSLSTLLTKEHGKVLSEARAEIQSLENTFEFYSGFGGKINGTLTYTRYGKEPVELKVRRNPLGVCVAIVPFNFPISLFAWKVAPALICGNTVVVKPASTTPLTEIAMVHLLSKAGVPKGVVNIVTGPGGVLGEELVTNSKVAKVAFTGSTETGKRILRLASSSIKKVTLELGGSDPAIVMRSADIERAAAGIFTGRFRNTGQSCNAVKRVYVERTIADQFLKMLKHHIEKVKLGHGLNRESSMGPLNNVEQLRSVELLVEDAKERNAKVIAGGARPDELKNGFFYLPTLLTDVPDDAEILNVECFGPALPVVSVKDIEEAIEKANMTRYGLGASIWTNDERERKEAEKRIEAGMLFINFRPFSTPEAPFGGVKESGLGRELGFEGLNEYLETQSIRTYMG